MAQAASSAATAKGQAAGKERLVRRITVVAGDSAEEHGRQPETGAAAEAVVVVSDDEEMQEEPDPAHAQTMSEAHAAAAGQLEEQGDNKAALEMWTRAVAGDPTNPTLYWRRGKVHMELQKEREAVTDFTVAMDMDGCLQLSQFEALLFRGGIKHRLGDLRGADDDYKAAHKGAPGEEEKRKAFEFRNRLVTEQVKVAKERQARKKARKPQVSRYGSVMIEELEPEEGTSEHEEMRVHERMLAWQEAALKVASQARGEAARLAKKLAAEQARIRAENEKRADRNLVRAARRRSAAEAAERARQQATQAAAAADGTAGQREQQEQGPVLIERTRIPIQIMDGGRPPSSASSASSSRSSQSRLAGYESESESGEEQEGAAAAPAAAAPEAAGAAAEGAAPAAAGEEEEAPAGEEVEQEQAAGAAAAAAVAAAAETEEAAEEPAAVAAEDEKPVQEAAVEEAEAAEEETEAAEEEPSEGEEPAADAPDQQPAASESVPAALPSDAELEEMKGEADRLQRAGQHEEAEKAYGRYLALRPADQRAWSNRAENHCKAERWDEALTCCNEALSLLAPTHTVPPSKLHVRRSSAYLGMGRLQEALRDLEEAEGLAEAEGDVKSKPLIARRQQRVLADMAARGIQPAPTRPSDMGAPAGSMRATAAACQVDLPHLPVVPERPPHEADVDVEEAEAEARQGTAGQSGSGADAAGDGPEAEEAAQGAAQGAAPEPDQAAEQLKCKQASEEAREKGNVCFRKHQWEQAVRHYERAIELDPSCKLAFSNKAAALLKLHRWEEARDAANEALSIDNSLVKARHRLAHAYLGAGLPHFAVLNMRMVVEAQPGDQAMQRQLAEMEREYRRALAEGHISSLEAELAAL